MIRLDKYLSDTGAATRREAKLLIRAGRVTVNGAAAAAPEMKVDPASVRICVDGTLLRYRRYRYYMMDKPPGVLTATEDRDQKTVLDLLPPELRRFGLVPAGRLDKDTTGLLLLTDNGDYVHRVISPKNHVPKVYLARTDGMPAQADVERFVQGVTWATARGACLQSWSFCRSCRRAGSPCLKGNTTWSNGCWPAAARRFWRCGDCQSAD